MIPSAESILGAHAFLARRFGLTSAPSEAGVRNALAMARALATQDTDEPAALFFALAMFPRALGDAWRVLPAVVAINHAVSLGLRLRMTRDELLPFYGAIVTRTATFEEVRAWFGKHMDPL